MDNFRKAWKALPKPLRTQTRREIMEECYLITENQFNMLRIGRIKISAYAEEAIKTAFARHGVDAESGEILKPRKHEN